MIRFQPHYIIFFFIVLFVVNVFAGGDRRGRSPLENTRPRLSLLSNKPHAVLPLPFNENFDSGLGSWFVDGQWNIPVNPTTISVLSPAIHPTLVILPEPPGMAYLPTPLSGNGMAWFGQPSTGTFIGDGWDTIIQDPLNGGTSFTQQFGSLISPAIDMTMASHGRLTFASAWEIEGVDVDAYDSMAVYISTDGVNFNIIGLLNPLNDVDGESWKPYSSGGLAQPMVWNNYLFDLTPYVGNTVHLEFRFNTGDDLYNGFRGWFVDDVSVTADALLAPDITSIVPSTSAAGEIVDIFGQNFANGATIEVDGIFVLSSVFSTGQAEIEAPFLTPGQYDVKLTNPDGQFDIMVNGLTITSTLPPDAFNIDPDSALVGTSVFVTINGSDFQPGAAVTIGGITLGNLTIVDPFTITGNSPSTLPTGAYTVVVTNPDGQFDQLPAAFTVYSMTGIDDGSDLHSTDFALLQNYPNPFNPSTKIEFQIRDAALVKLTIYNLAGQEIATLVNEHHQAGTHSIEFNAADLPSGIYFYRLTVGDYSAMRKMVLMK